MQNQNYSSIIILQQARTIYKTLLPDQSHSKLNLKYDEKTDILEIKIEEKDPVNFTKSIKHLNDKLILCYKTIKFVNEN